VVKCLAIWRRLFFEKALFDEFGDGLCNFRRPFFDAGIEHPPMKDAVERILCLRMHCQIVQNFWRRRWKWRIGKHTFGCQWFRLSSRRASNFRGCACQGELCAGRRCSGLQFLLWKWLIPPSLCRRQKCAVELNWKRRFPDKFVLSFR